MAFSNISPLRIIREGHLRGQDPCRVRGAIIFFFFLMGPCRVGGGGVYRWPLLCSLLTGENLQISTAMEQGGRLYL